MPESQSLDELIAAKAVEFSEQVRATAGVADKEEEIRIEVEKQLAFIQKEAGIKLEGKHEFTVASGRVDSVYDRVIIEYKNPASADRIGPTLKSPGCKKVVDQIKKRFYDMRTEHSRPLNTLFGVGLDGNRILFVRYRDDKWQPQEPVELDRHNAERFLWALFNLGEKGKPFSPEYLSGDFGSEAKLALEGVRTLYEAITTTENPKARTFFGQWKILFGEVCGYDVDNPSEKIKKLAKSYQVPIKGLKPAELLFALQTYYALFMKLLASQIVAFFHRLPTPLEKMIKAGSSQKLREEMRELEAGGIFRHFNITNFLEGDLFAWYLATSSLFRDVSCYSFDSYRKKLATELTLDDLQSFTTEFLSRHRRKLQKDGDFVEFLVPDALKGEGLPERYRRATFDRRLAIEHGEVDFLALGHPFVDAMLEYVGSYDFGGLCAARRINQTDLAGRSGFLFLFVIRRRVAREDSDECLFDFQPVFVTAEGTIDVVCSHAAITLTAEDAGKSKPLPEDVQRAYEAARAHVQATGDLWDWAEEIEFLGMSWVEFA